MTGSAIIDVLLALVFVYFLLSLVCSALNEAVAGVLEWRARDLEAGIRNLLEPGKATGTTQPVGSIGADPVPLDAEGGRGPERRAAVETVPLVEQLYAHPLIRSLFTEPVWALSRKKIRRPSYIDSRQFTSALMDVLGDTRPTNAPGVARAAIAPAPSLEEVLSGLEDAPLKVALTAYYREVQGDVQAFRLRVESWFDDAMQRTSGRYSRRVQMFLVVYSVAFTVLFNIDSLAIGQVLWSNGAVRAAVAAEAAAVPAGSVAPAPASLQDVAQQVEALPELQLPVFWTAPSRCHASPLGCAIAKVFGLAVSAAAGALGAPFWFDVLNKLARLRTSAPPREGRGS